MIISGIILGVILLYFIITYNSFVILRKGIEQSRSTIDVYLKQRFDLIPNLIECVKEYMKYEQTTLEKIVELRNQYNDKHDFESANKVNDEYNRLLLIAEEYPEIKAGEQFILLQNSLKKIESQLQAARRIYNGDVTMYNTKVQTIPSNIVASILRYKEKELFVIEETEAKNINMNF